MKKQKTRKESLVCARIQLSSSSTTTVEKMKESQEKKIVVVFFWFWLDLARIPSAETIFIINKRQKLVPIQKHDDDDDESDWVFFLFLFCGKNLLLIKQIS